MFKTTLVAACVLCMAGFVVFAAWHEVAWTIAGGSAILGIGIKFAFSAMANVVIASVEPDQTGHATGVNTIVRTIGGSVGAQVSAAIVTTAFVAGTTIPAESGYTTAFTVSAAAMALAVLVSLAAPGRDRPSLAPPRATLRDGHWHGTNYPGAMHEPAWTDTNLVDRFADEAYASVKGYVRTRVLHHHLLEHLPPAPAPVLDVGGGAGHQSFPLALAGYDVTLLDSSPAMLDKARQRLDRLPDEARKRVRLVEADGENADDAVDGQRFAAVLCHGVLGYQEDPEPLLGQLCRCVADGGVVSIMSGNAATTAVRPALQRRWDEALAAFDTTTETVPGLGVRGRAHTVEELGEELRRRGVEPLRWYGVWLFVDWLEFSGVELDPDDAGELSSIVQVELEASRRDPYRRLSRVFHLVARKPPKAQGVTTARV